MEQVQNKKPYLDTQNLEAREYQIKIAQQCINKNSLVVLPTGLGKTIIAVLVASKTLELFPPDSKIIILAPTRPLINQHYDTFTKFLNIAHDKFAILTGKTPPEKRDHIFLESQILFFTPQTLRNDLVNNRYSLKDTALIIFDEVHHTSGDYPYALISDALNDHNPDGFILGLTASPGASKQKVDQLCETLQIPLQNIHIRTRRDEDVQSYLKPMNIYKIGVNLTPLMEQVYKAITSLLEERLQYLSHATFLDKRSDKLFNKVIRKDLLKLNAELVGLLKNEGDKTTLYTAISINAQALILYHMIELVEQQGLDVLLTYLESVYKDAKKQRSSKAVKIIAAEYRIRNIYFELKKNYEFSPEDLVHPKYQVLRKVLLDELHSNPSSQILVFIKLRDSVKNVVKKLSHVKGLRPVRFVGQTTKSKDDKGLSQNNQIEILEQFKKGVYNVLVSTNVGEEGLDISECDLVVFYDVVASEIRMIQRKGRTARHRKGKVIILYCKDTNDEIYLKIVLAKLKRMNVTLKDPQTIHKVRETTIHKDTLEKHDAIPKVQSKLESFLYSQPQTSLKRIRISQLLPMKYGLRIRLQEDIIEHEIVESDLHIFICNKILLQIFPSRISFKSLQTEISNLKQICTMLIIIIDFIDFKEKFEGEKRALKKEFQKFAKNNNCHVISIDNQEELYFIIKNIYFNQQKEEA